MVSIVVTGVNKTKMLKSKQSRQDHSSGIKNNQKYSKVTSKTKAVLENHTLDAYWLVL